MPSKPEAFEEHAVRCDRRADGAGRDDLRMLYQDLARQWRGMAEQVRELRQMRDGATVADASPTKVLIPRSSY